MDRIEPSQFVSADTSILDLIILFGDKKGEAYYVLRRNELVGVIRYDDSFKPAGRLPFFTLALEIEDQALRLCQSDRVRENCWRAISDNRRHKAAELFEKRCRRPPRSERARCDISDTIRLIACTNLADKATMIWKEKLIVPARRTDLLGFFKSCKQCEISALTRASTASYCRRKSLRVSFLLL